MLHHLIPIRQLTFTYIIIYGKSQSILIIESSFLSLIHSSTLAFPDSPWLIYTYQSQKLDAWPRIAEFMTLAISVLCQILKTQFFSQMSQ